VVDPDQIIGSMLKRPDTDDLSGIEVDMGAMEGWFRAIMRHQAGLDFPDQPSPSHRYYAPNEMYDIGDALVLACTVRHLRPRRIIEVGSGFSSAALLDTLDRTPELATDCVFVEPNTERLDALLRPADAQRVEIRCSGVQEVPLTVFDRLEANDILFLDTTHVSKTGSDVNYELFEVLPRLKSGVFIHFHDVFAGFEYPHSWIFEQNRSWNEQYILRAFLMYNEAFDVVYMGDLFARRKLGVIDDLCPLIKKNHGGNLWLRKR